MTNLGKGLQTSYHLIESFKFNGGWLHETLGKSIHLDIVSDLYDPLSSQSIQLTRGLWEI